MNRIANGGYKISWGFGTRSYRQDRLHDGTIKTALTGGDPRSLGRAEEVVRLVLDNPRRVSGLFECLFVEDEIVRMRASDALEKVCRERPDLLSRFTRRLLREVPKIEQPSVQWHLAQILAQLPLTGQDKRRAIAILKRNLDHHDDWIVINLTLESLATFVRRSRRLRSGFVELLGAFVRDSHKSVASRAKKLLAEFEQKPPTQQRRKRPR